MKYPYICITGRLDKVFDKILAAKSDNNIKFNDLCTLLNKMGFESRVKGSHHIFYKPGLDDIINIQELDGQQPRNSEIR